MNVETSILLPAATIGVFARDKTLKETVEKLVNDWRFARTTFEVIDGDVGTAMSRYKTKPAHNVILIETQSVDDTFVSQLEDLAQYCDETTAAIVIGHVNDVNLYRKLIAMGVSDYLVLPLGSDVLAEVMAKSMIDRLGASGSKLVACLGAKGGVGTSSIAQSLATGIAEFMDEKTFILDAAGGCSYLAVAMGGDPLTSLSAAAKASVASDKDSLKRMFLKPTHKLSVLASGGEGILETPVTTEGFEDILDAVLEEHPATIVDLSQAESNVMRVTLQRAHVIVIVAQATVQSLRNVRSLLQDIKDLRGGQDSETQVKLVINMKGMFGDQEVPLSDIEKALNKKVDLVLPFDVKSFPTVEVTGQKIHEAKAVRPMAQKLAAMVENLFDARMKDEPDDAPANGILGSLLSKVKK
ncbi:MAG: CpaE family protein [Pseudobdellovibrionaceae bacterium]